MIANFLGCKLTITKEETTKFSLNDVLWYLGLSQDIISKKKPQFVSKFR